MDNEVNQNQPQNFETEPELYNEEALETRVFADYYVLTQRFQDAKAYNLHETQPGVFRVVEEGLISVHEQIARAGIAVSVEEMHESTIKDYVSRKETPLNAKARQIIQKYQSVSLADAEDSDESWDINEETELKSPFHQDVVMTAFKIEQQLNMGELHIKDACADMGELLYETVQSFKAVAPEFSVGGWELFWQQMHKYGISTSTEGEQIPINSMVHAMHANGPMLDRLARNPEEVRNLLDASADSKQPLSIFTKKASRSVQRLIKKSFSDQ